MYVVRVLSGLKPDDFRVFGVESYIQYKKFIKDVIFLY